MTKFKDAKINLTEKIINEYGDIAVGICDAWNEMMDKLERDEDKYIIEVTEEAKEHLLEAMEFFEIKFNEVISLSLCVLVQNIRAVKAFKKNNYK